MIISYQWAYMGRHAQGKNNKKVSSMIREEYHSMNLLIFSKKSAILSGLSLKSSVVSMTSTFSCSYDLNHFSCFSWMSLRQSSEISVSSGRMRLLVRWWHFSGVHLRQMILVLSTSAIVSKLLYRDLKTSCSASFMYPRSFMSSEKTYLSARTLLSEIFIFSGWRWLASLSFWTRVKIAYIWKVNPHRLGSMQYFSSMLIFFPLRFCQSLTGSSIQRASGIFCLRISTMVDLPQPIFPSIVKWNSDFGSSGFMTPASPLTTPLVFIPEFPAKNYINQIQIKLPRMAQQRQEIQIENGGLSNQK